MQNIIDIQAVFFDFDGVVLDSVEVKTRAFAEMFRQYGPEVQEAVISYHLSHGGVSRFEKFRYFYSELLNLPLSDQKLVSLSNRFSELVLAKVLESAFIPGILETLKELLHLKIPAFVISGTPDEEIHYLVKNKGLGAFFKEIHGAPRSKIAIVRDILERTGYDPSLCWFFGDAMTDWQAAKNCGVNFIGIVADYGKSPFPEDTTITTVVELPANC